MRGLVQELSGRIRAAVRAGLHDVGSRYVEGTAKGETPSSRSTCSPSAPPGTS